MKDDFSKYELIKGKGLKPSKVYLAAKNDGLDFFACIRMLRQLFNLSLVQAKEITVVTDTDFNSLDEYQEWLASEIEIAFPLNEEE